MTSTPRAEPGRIAHGANGGSRARFLYRRSPLRRLLKVDLDHRGLRPEDVFLASYPRSGNAWLRFLVLEMCGQQATFDSAYTDVPYIGGQSRAPALLPSGGRLIKTHETYLPVYRHAIHLVRDPRDVVISYFRYMQRIERIVIEPTDDVAATFDRFIDTFLAGHADAHGTWQNHLESWLDASRSGRCRTILLRYEDLRADPVGKVLELGRWMGLELTREDAAGIVERCSLERMRDAEQLALSTTPKVLPPAAHRTGISVLGNGSVGGWHDALTVDQQRRFALFNAGIAAARLRAGDPAVGRRPRTVRKGGVDVRRPASEGSDSG